jgi:hypothetical protein
MYCFRICYRGLHFFYCQYRVIRYGLAVASSQCAIEGPEIFKGSTPSSDWPLSGGKTMVPALLCMLNRIGEFPLQASTAIPTGSVAEGFLEQIRLQAEPFPAPNVLMYMGHVQASTHTHTHMMIICTLCVFCCFL